MNKPNYQSVIASVCIFDTIAASRSSISLIMITMNLPEEWPLFDKPSSSIGRMQSDLAALFVTQFQKQIIEMANDLLMTNFSLIRESHQARQLQKVI